MAKELKSIRLRKTLVKAIEKYRKKEKLDDFTAALELAVAREMKNSGCLKGDMLL